MTTSRLSKKVESRHKVLGYIGMPHNKSLSLRQVSGAKIAVASFVTDTWRKSAKLLDGYVFFCQIAAHQFSAFLHLFGNCRLRWHDGWCIDRHFDRH
jgi:hypothetical protein